MIRASSVFIALALGVSACADQPTGPTIRPPESPSANKGAPWKSVLEYHARGDDLVPDHAAFQLAVNESREVYVPRGTFYFTEPVRVPSNTRIYGEGAASLLIATGIHWTRWDLNNDNRRPAVFYAYMGESATTTDVVFENLAFRGEAGATEAFAIDTRWSQRVQVRDVEVENMGVVHFDHVTDSEVLRTRGAGVVNRPFQAMIIINSRRVLVRRANVRRYHNGIMWWGGVADPDSAHFTREKRVGDMTIDSSTVADVGAGNWGGNGEYIRVKHNTVDGCSDVCLDAEGSDSVSFVQNTARHAGASVLASYFFSTRILFDTNTIEQNGSDRRPDGGLHTGLPSAEGDASVAWTRMFWFPTKRGTADMSVELRNNKFTYTGAHSRVGLLQKSSSRHILIDNNVLRNTVIDMAGELNGGVAITRNQIYLDYDAGRPAIYTGNNSIVLDPWRSGTIILNNKVRSWARQSAPGVSVLQVAHVYPISSDVSDNEIGGFASSITFASDDRWASHSFRAVGNFVDGTIARVAGTGVRDEVHSNTYTGGGGGGDPICPPDVDHC